MNYRIVGIVVASISALLAFLPLAHDSDSWPYSGPTWLWIGFGIAMVLGGLAWIIVVKAKNKPLTFVVLLSSFITAVAGAVVAAGATSITLDRSGSSAIEIESVHEGQLVENPIAVSGSIKSPLAAGESLWLVVANLPPQGGDPGAYYLQPGPCGVLGDGKSWSCPSVKLVDNGRKPVGLYLLGVRGDQVGTFVQRLIAGGRLDERNQLAGQHKLNVPTNTADPVIRQHFLAVKEFDHSDPSM